MGGHESNSSSVYLAAVLILGVGCFALGLASQATSAAEDTDQATSPEEAGTNESVPTIGPDDAPVLIVEAADFNCTWCGVGVPGRAHGKASFIKRIMSEHDNDVQYAFKHFLVFRRNPITRASSELAAIASMAAHRQGRFWSYHDHLFLRTGVSWDNELLAEYVDELGLDGERFRADLKDSKLREAVRLDDAAGQAVGISGTPSVFINGLKVPNSAKADGWRRLIQDARDQVLALIRSGKASDVISARRMATATNAGETFAKHYHDHNPEGLDTSATSGNTPIIHATFGGQ